MRKNEKSKSMKNFFVEESRKTDRIIREIASKTSKEDVFIIKEGNEIKIAEEKETLFPTLVKKALKL